KRGGLRSLMRHAHGVLRHEILLEASQDIAIITGATNTETVGWSMTMSLPGARPILMIDPDLRPAALDTESARILFMFSTYTLCVDDSEPSVHRTVRQDAPLPSAL